MEKPVTIQDLTGISFYGNLKASTDSVLFVRASIDEEKDCYVYDLMQYTDCVRQLTDRGQVTGYVFKDPGTVYFTLPAREEDQKGHDNIQFALGTAAAGQSDGTEKKDGTRLMEISLSGGEASQKAVLPLKGASLRCILEDGRLVFLCQEHIHEDCDPVHSDYEVVDEIPWYFNGAGYINKRRDHLYVYDPADGSLMCPAAGYDVQEVQSSGSCLYFTANPDLARDMNTCGFYSVDCAEKKPQVRTWIQPGTYAVYGFGILEQEAVLFATDSARFGLNENPTLYTLNLGDGQLQHAAVWEEALGNTVGTDCAVVPGNALLVHDNTLYFTNTIVEHNTLYKYEDGAVHQVYASEGTIHAFGFRGEDLYFIGALPNELQQLYVLHHGQVQCLSDFNSQLSDHYIARAQPVFYENHTGAEQMGWVLYPRNFNPDKTYPGILDIHGGPKTVYGTVFYHEMQVWASAGYFVFFCNPFGSDGQGNEYAWMKDRYGTVDYEDLMRFTDQVLRKIPQIDPARLGVTGGSYGGFMTNWIIGHTDRFAAAASQRSISNWISFLGTSDIGPDFTVDQQGYDLDHIDRLWEHSPLKYASAVKTPTLFIHSDEDYRCPLEQGMQMFTAVHRTGIPSRMIVFHHENHDLSRTGKPSHRIRRLREITDWMKKYAPVTEE